MCQVARQLGIQKALGIHFTGEKGKLQIVIGLLCDESGEPVYWTVLSYILREGICFSYLVL